MRRRLIPVLPVFLGLVMALFLGILFYVFAAAKRANPVVLDENGRPRAAETHR